MLFVYGKLKSNNNNNNSNISIYNKEIKATLDIAKSSKTVAKPKLKKVKKYKIIEKKNQKNSLIIYLIEL